MPQEPACPRMDYRSGSPRGTAVSASAPEAVLTSCRELITSVPHRPPAKERCIHSVSGLADASFSRSGVRTKQVSGAPVGGFGLVVCRVPAGNPAFFMHAANRFHSFLLGVIIHKMATPPGHAGNATICAHRFKEQCAVTSGRGYRVRRRGRDSARGSLWRGTSAGVCGG